LLGVLRRPGGCPATFVDQIIPLKRSGPPPLSEDWLLAAVGPSRPDFLLNFLGGGGATI
jgi:hypothetical protein